MTAKRKTIPDPDWNQQLIGIGMSQKSINDMTFRPGDHDFFIKMNETFTDALKSEISESLAKSFKQNNRLITSKVAHLIVEQSKEVSDSIVIMMKAMEGIASDINGIKHDIDGIKSDVSDIKNRLETIEDEVESDAKRISKLEEWAKIPMEFDERLKIIEGYKNRFHAVENYTSPKWTAFRWGAALLISVLIMMVLHSYFPKFLDWMR